MRTLKNRKGQSLIEYLVLVCLIAVGSIGVIRVVGKNVKVQFANVSRALSGKEELATDDVESSNYSKSDFSNFMKGSNNGGN